MKTAAMLLVAVSILSVGQPALGVAESTTLTGEYAWNQRNGGGDLEAVFTPSGAGRWDVSFGTFQGTHAEVYDGDEERTGTLRLG